MKTFSEFTLNLFFLLFGFFLGNLFPNKSILENLFNRTIETQENILNSPVSFTAASRILAFNFNSWGLSNLGFVSRIFPYSFPGPAQVGIFILFLSEFINWNGAFLKKRGGRSNRSGIPGATASRPPQIFLFSNSFKIGLLFGIFVDAFKVGS